MQKIVQRFWGKGRKSFKVKSERRGKEENRSLHRRTQMRGPQKAQGLQAASPTELRPASPNLIALTLSPLAFNLYFSPFRSQAVFLLLQKGLVSHL